MATKYLKICDGCDKQETVEEGIFGAGAQPPGWLVVSAWQSEDKPALACSWGCLAKVGKDREKDVAKSEQRD